MATPNITGGYFGFLPYGLNAGAAPTFSLTKRRIASGNASPVYRGDPVMPVTSSATGYITVALPGSLSTTVPLSGIFWSCEYLSVSQKRTVRSLYWPGSDANGDVTAYVIDAPQMKFVACANSSPASYNSSWTPGTWGTTILGQNCQFANNGGSTTTGMSGCYVSAIGTTASYPFTVLDLVTDPPGSPGSDPTSNYNYLIVGFNNEWLRDNTAVTGIS